MAKKFFDDEGADEDIGGGGTEVGRGWGVRRWRRRGG